MNPFPSRRLFAAGFTLVEMLVAIAALSILVLVVAQLLNSSGAVIALGTKHMGADLQARLVFDRMAADFGAMVMREDVDCVFSPQTGNDSLFFYGEGPSYAPLTGSSTQQSTVSLIGYRINSSYQLERLGKYLTWDGASAGGGSTQPGSIIFLTPLNGQADPTTTIPVNWSGVLGSAPYGGGTDSSYHVLAEGVFRLEICYLIKGSNGLFSYSQSPPSLSATNVYAVNLGDNALHDLSSISAIVVALAVLDDASLKLIPSLSDLSQQFPDPQAADLAASPPVLMLQSWENKLASTGFAAKAGIPQSVASQVRIYQRIFYLNH